MKYLILLVLLLLSCTTQVTEKEVIEITKETIDNVIQTPINQRVFPITINPEISASIEGITDFNNGIMYVDNCYQTDNIIHTLDLSYIVGKQQVLIALLFRHIDGCDNEYGTYKVRPKDMLVNYLSASVLLNVKEDLVYVLTDENGCIEWYSEYSWPYEKYAVMEIIAKWYSVGVTINNDLQ